jgi:hypothetical protein
MKRELVRLIVGVLVIGVHIFSFAMIMFFKTEWLSISQRTDVALLLLPVTATYVMAIVKSAVDNKSTLDFGDPVNLNYVVVVFLVTAAFLTAVVTIVVQMPGPIAPTIDDAKQWLIGLEAGLGGAFGYIATDLFGKIELVERQT